jgi:hypothetical protein
VRRSNMATPSLTGIGQVIHALTFMGEGDGSDRADGATVLSRSLGKEHASPQACRKRANVLQRQAPRGSWAAPSLVSLAHQV